MISVTGKKKKGLLGLVAKLALLESLLPLGLLIKVDGKSNPIDWGIHHPLK